MEILRMRWVNCLTAALLFSIFTMLNICVVYGVSKVLSSAIPRAGLLPQEVYR